MILVSQENARSFAHSMDEELSSPEQFLTSTSGWLLGHQPVLAHLSRAMALRLGGDERAAEVTESVLGYMVRLLDHAEANERLRHQLEGEICPVHGNPAAAAVTSGKRKYCCHRQQPCTHS